MICILLIIIFLGVNYIPLRKSTQLSCVLLSLVVIGLAEYFSFLSQDVLSGNSMALAVFCYVLLMALLDNEKRIDLMSVIPILVFFCLSEGRHFSELSILVISLLVFCCFCPKTSMRKFNLLVGPIFGFISLSMILLKLQGPIDSSLSYANSSNLVLSSFSIGLKNIFYIYSICVTGINYIRNINCKYSSSLFILVNLYFSSTMVDLASFYISAISLFCYLLLKRRKSSLYSLFPLLVLLVFQFNKELSFILILWLLIDKSLEIFNTTLSPFFSRIDLRLVAMTMCLLIFIFFNSIHTRIYVISIVYLALAVGKYEQKKVKC